MRAIFSGLTITALALFSASGAAGGQPSPEATDKVRPAAAQAAADEYQMSLIYLSGSDPVTRLEAALMVTELRNGASFEALARYRSEDVTAGRGGDYGFVRPEQLPDPLRKAVASLPVGEISEPIEGDGGLYIITVTDAR